jgi:hypothetical protein
MNLWKFSFFAILAAVLFWTPSTADAAARWRLHYWRHRPRVKVIHAIHRPFSQCRNGNCRNR